MGDSVKQKFKPIANKILDNFLALACLLYAAGMFIAGLYPHSKNIAILFWLIAIFIGIIHYCRRAYKRHLHQRNKDEDIDESQ
jgi:Flp pilus assembly protein TadB